MKAAEGQWRNGIDINITVNVITPDNPMQMSTLPAKARKKKKVPEYVLSLTYVVGYLKSSLARTGAARHPILLTSLWSSRHTKALFSGCHHLRRRAAVIVRTMQMRLIYAFPFRFCCRFCQILHFSSSAGVIDGQWDPEHCQAWPCPLFLCSET